jgi:hypothetical protein
MFRVRSLVSFGLLSLSCKIEPPLDLAPVPLENSCSEDSDCVAGGCDASGRCVRATTSFKALMLEVIPPASDSGYGGRQFFQRVAVGSMGEPLELVLPQQRVDGRVSLWLGTCIGHTILFGLRPRVEALGLHPVRLAARSPTLPTRFENDDVDYATRLNRFTLLSVPAGQYDIYFRDTGREVPTPECPAMAVPHIERGVSFASGESSIPYRFDQNAPEPVELRIVVPWLDDLEDWTVDTVHNITGERMSTQAELAGAAKVIDESNNVEVTVSVRHGHVTGPDYRIGAAFPGDSFVRLRPPDPSTRPTVYFARLVPPDAVGSAEVSLPQVGPFSELVNYRAWVWGEGRSSLPVPGQVLLSARTLDDVRGAAVTMTRTIDIAEDGSIQALLLPGTYVADVVPSQGSGFGRFRTEVVVWEAPPEGEAGTEQAGFLIAVPRAATVSGSLRGPGGIPPTGTSVRIQPSARGGFTLTAQVPRFQPRTTEMIVDADGRFSLPVDCSSCTEETPSLIDVVFRPPEGGGLPWLVIRDVSLSSDLDLGRVSVAIPRMLDGVVKFQTRPSQDPLPYSGPRVRAYVMFDRDGNVVDDVALRDCIDVDSAVAPDSAEPCVQRVIQIGETSTDSEGRFQLALPQGFGDLN